jgi:Domain of unknown function (DUF6484)
MSELLVEIDDLLESALTAPTVGRIVRVSLNGEVFVEYPGNEDGPIRARMALSALERTAESVLLVFENGDRKLPIIVGVIRDRAVELSAAHTDPGDEFVLEARKNILLVCGKSSIRLQKDGRIILKGVKILSRASESNKIRGASVEIN